MQKEEEKLGSPKAMLFRYYIVVTSCDVLKLKSFQLCQTLKVFFDKVYLELDEYMTSALIRRNYESLDANYKMFHALKASAVTYKFN